MNFEEFWAWLDTCPTHKWDVVEIEGDYCRVIFPIDEGAIRSEEELTTDSESL